MKNNSIITVYMFGVLILTIVLQLLEYTVYSKITGAIFTISMLIVSWHNLKSLKKQLLLIYLPIVLFSGGFLIYVAFFKSDNIHLLYGSLIWFFISIPMSMISMEIVGRKLWK